MPASPGLIGFAEAALQANASITAVTKRRHGQSRVTPMKMWENVYKLQTVGFQVAGGHPQRQCGGWPACPPGGAGAWRISHLRSFDAPSSHAWHSANTVRGGLWRCRPGGWPRCGARTTMGRPSAAPECGNTGPGLYKSSQAHAPGQPGRLPPSTGGAICGSGSVVHSSSQASVPGLVAHQKRAGWRTPR